MIKTHPRHYHELVRLTFQDRTQRLLEMSADDFPIYNAARSMLLYVELAANGVRAGAEIQAQARKLLDQLRRAK